MTVRVKPSGNQWTVTQNGRTVSNHRLKRRAKKQAKQTAKNGESIVIQGSNGQIQDQKTRQRGR